MDADQIEDSNDSTSEERESGIRDANVCLFLGAGVGALGAGGALAAGAVCPLCVVVSPALIGVGLFRRWQLRKKETDTSPSNN